MDYQVINLLYRCSREYSHKKLRIRDLSSTESMLCSYIFSNPDCSQERVSTALRIDKTTVAKALYTLESKGFVLRTPDPVDRRKKQLRLSDSGREKVQGVVNLHNNWLAQVIGCLSAQEQAQFEDYCKRLLLKAEELSDNRHTEETADAR